MSNKTVPTGVAVEHFLATITPERRQHEARVMDALFREVTGYFPKMWGASILGYGRYHYLYKSGREGDYLATGFAPRKATLVVYIMPGLEMLGDILSRLGKHKVGKSCIYINRLSDIDTDVLSELVSAGLRDLAARWPITPDARILA